jgi:hypothetical protein
MLLLGIFGALLLNTLGETLVGYVLTKDLANGCASPPARFWLCSL